MTAMNTDSKTNDMNMNKTSSGSLSSSINQLRKMNFMYDEVLSIPGQSCVCWYSYDGYSAVKHVFSSIGEAIRYAQRLHDEQE